MGLLIFYFLLALLVSFFCSLLESCFLSIRGVYIQSQFKKKKKFALTLRQLKKEVNRPLSAILTLNTVANIVGASGVGAQVHSLFGNSYVTASSILLTVMILIFSEIIPKTLGASHWKTLAPFCAYSIQVLIVVCYPFVWIADKINKALSQKSRSAFTREEMIATAEMGATAGAIKPKESHIIINLLTLDSTQVSQIMTPRSVIMAFDENQTIGETLEKYKSYLFFEAPHFQRKSGFCHGADSPI